jgi:hypothetical protein
VPDFGSGLGSLNAASSSLYYINYGTGTSGTCTQISAATLQTGLYGPFATAVDGNDWGYVTNRGNGSNGSTISVVDTSSGTAAGTVAVSPSTGYEPQYWNGSSLTNMLLNPYNIAVGPSGEVWITSPSSNSIVEIIGLPCPTGQRCDPA